MTGVNVISVYGFNAAAAPSIVYGVSRTPDTATTVMPELPPSASAEVK